MHSSTIRTVLRNIASNWTGFLVNIAVVFFLTPFVLHSLGDTRYGVWILVTSLTGYCGLLDAGLRGGVMQYTTRYLATRDFQKLNATLSTAMAAMLCVAVAVIVVASGMAFAAPHLFEIPIDARHEVTLCILIIGGSVAADLCLFPYSAVLTGAQRFDLLNGVSILMRLASAGLTWRALTQGHGLVAISLINAGTELCGSLARWRISKAVVPELDVRPSRADRATFREIYSYGAWTFLITISQTFFGYAVRLVIAAFMPVAAVTWYSNAAAISLYLESFVRPVDQVFFPLLTQFHATGQHGMLRKVYVAGTRVSAVVASALAIAAALWADDFYRFWIGVKYVTPGEFPTVSFLCQILLIGMVGRMISCFPGQVLHASLRVKTLTGLIVCEAVSNFALSCLLVRWWGLTGVAIATIAPILVFRAVAFPAIVGRLLEVPLAAYLWQVVGRTLVVAAGIALDVLMVRHFLPPQNLKEVIAYGLFSALLGAPIVLMVGLDADERTRLVTNPMQKLMGRIFKRPSAAAAARVAGVPQIADE